MADYSPWIGRVSTAEDIIAPGPLRRLAALLDSEPGETIDTMTPLGHWLYFLPEALQSEIGLDGHPALGGSLPAFHLPRRMWAGSRVRFEWPIPIGSRAIRRTEISSIVEKNGASGPLIFVTLRHEIEVAGRIGVIEEQDLVYRQAGTAGASLTLEREHADDEARSDDVKRRFDSKQLFRFSALTYNAHRIHYDREYARDVEGYPALVVHGPFQAVTLMEHFTKTVSHSAVTSFSFRAQAPLFEGQEARLGLKIGEGEAALWLQPPGSGPSLTAAIGFTRR